MRRRLKRAALWVWQKVPFPRAVRWAMLWILNTKYLVGVTAVVLNEAVELANTYGTDDSGRFVNGVLSAVAEVLRPAEG